MDYGWSTTYGETADGLMYIGAHRNYPRHLFALGGPGDSVTGAFLAARILRARAAGRAREERTPSSGGRGERARRTRSICWSSARTPTTSRSAWRAPSPSTRRSGHRVGLCDLTAGEMGSNGTVDERLAEAEAARAVLGAAWRVNLRLPDRALGTSADARARRRRPGAIGAAARPWPCPYWSDRHPDHVRASELLTDAVFSAGLRRFDAEGEAWKPAWVCYYFINDHAAPSFVVDVSDHYETKRRALACHATQFAPRGADAVATRLTSSRFNQLIESRDAQFGAQIGVAFAEGFVVRQPRRSARI